ncbi:MAG: hypothetical protein WAL64_01475 [Candidatus Dormiibacterota bacterium]
MELKAKRVSPAILPPLKEALALSFWYKSDLQAFVRSCLPGNLIVAHLDWTGYKRNIVSQLVDGMAQEQHKYFEDLLRLLLATADITDPAHLRHIDDGQRKYDDAVTAIAALTRQVEPYRQLRSEEDEAQQRRLQERARSDQQRAVIAGLAELGHRLSEIVSQEEHRRGYSLERFLTKLFDLFDIDVRGPFSLAGEQIDGAFSLDGTEFILEAKWQSDLTSTADLAVFAEKIGRRLDNTLGLFVSMNGFQPAAISLYSRKRPTMFVMDGADLSTVVDGRIPLPELLRRKRQHAARTGEISLSASTIIG